MLGQAMEESAKELPEQDSLFRTILDYCGELSDNEKMKTRKSYRQLPQKAMKLLFVRAVPKANIISRSLVCGLEWKPAVIGSLNFHFN